MPIEQQAQSNRYVAICQSPQPMYRNDFLPTLLLPLSVTPTRLFRQIAIIGVAGRVVRQKSKNEH
jgi:hypothetical protein